MSSAKSNLPCLDGKGAYHTPQRQACNGATEAPISNSARPHTLNSNSFFDRWLDHWKKQNQVTSR